MQMEIDILKETASVLKKIQRQSVSLKNMDKAVIH